MYGIAWSEYFAPDASTDRGWLKAICAPFEWDRHSEYNSNNMPVWDDEINAWREQSTLGNFLDYRPCRPWEPADKPLVHAICYANHQSKYCLTVSEAKQWIEEQVAKSRKDLAVQLSLIAA